MGNVLFRFSYSLDKAVPHKVVFQKNAQLINQNLSVWPPHRVDEIYSPFEGGFTEELLMPAWQAQQEDENKVGRAILRASLV